MGRTCEKCGATFKFLSLYERHRTRKTPCAPTMGLATQGPTNKCPHCGRYFTTYSNMRRHVRNTCAALHPKEKKDDLLEAADSKA